MAADREKWEAWLEREMQRISTGPSYASLTYQKECHGGPIDGMLAAVADSCFKSFGPRLIVPSLLVLQSGVEGPVVLEHAYARDLEGAFRYIGLQRRA